MRKQFYALICVAVALLPICILFGCSTDYKIEKWAKKASSSAFSVSYYNLGIDLKYMPENLTWGTLAIYLNPFVISGDKAEKITIENKDPKMLKALIEKVRTDFINFIDSLNLESDIKYKYMDFKTELVWLGHKLLTIMEIDKYGGGFKNQMFLLQVTEEELNKAKENYETRWGAGPSQYSGGKQPDGTYIYELRFTNKNEKIPLYVYDFSLMHKSRGELNFRELDEGSDYKPIKSNGIVAPNTTEEFQIKVDGYYGEYGSLQCRYRVEIGWFE